MDPTSQSQRKSVLNIHWKDWCWRWNSNTLATCWEELTHWKRPWCWQRLKAGGEGDNRGWNGWMVLPTRWTWVWVNSGSWRWTGRPGVLQSMALQRVRHDWATEQNWTGGWKQQQSILSQFWWPEGQTRAMLPLKTLEENLSSFLPSCCYLPEILDLPWLVAVSLQSLPLSLHGSFPVFTLIKIPIIQFRTLNAGWLHLEILN